MSYSRSFTKRIAVHYSGRVSYPASQNGGTVSYSGTEYEDVTVNIKVDTDAFDSSVQNCNSSVNVLTGAVVATEGAQVVSIRNNALRVGQTIIDGFFKTVRSEISQQIMELTNKINATLLQLNEMVKRCNDKQHQMEVDYNRISKRYLKIFDDLNNELENRVYELDKPAFLFRETCDESSYRAIGSDLVGTVAVAGSENSQLEARISASIAKKRALDTIRKAHTFLEKQKQTDHILHDHILHENQEAVYYMPVCFVEKNNSKNQIDREIYQSNVLGRVDDNELIDSFRGETWSSMSPQEAQQIKLYFNNELSAHYTAASNEHDDRVRACISRLFNINTIQVV